MATHPSEIYLESTPRSPTLAAPHRWPPESEHHRSRAPEFYGFVAWTSTYLLFVLYILWAILPDRYIVWFGITWYPNREWAILIPSWTIIVVLLTYFVYFSIAIRATPSFDEMSAISDSRISLPSPDVDVAHNPYLASASPRAIPELYDIPIGIVNRVLYHEAHRRVPPRGMKENEKSD